MATTTVTFTHDTSSQCPLRASDTARQALRKVATLCEGLAAGAYKGTSFTASQDAATGTVTLSGVDGVAATGTVTFDSSSGAWTATVAGAAFDGTGGDDDAAGEDLASQINGSLDGAVAGVITASNLDGVVTITAVTKGTDGNAITLAVTGTGVSRSAATLTGGADNDVTVTVGGAEVVTDTTTMDNEDAATAVAAAFNADATASQYATASASGAVVTLTANVVGPVGNAIPLSAATDGGTATASAAYLSGGTSTTYTL